jgi:hypothetical protein
MVVDAAADHITTTDVIAGDGTIAQRHLAGLKINPATITKYCIGITRDCTACDRQRDAEHLDAGGSGIHRTRGAAQVHRKAALIAGDTHDYGISSVAGAVGQFASARTSPQMCSGSLGHSIAERVVNFLIAVRSAVSSANICIPDRVQTPLSA